MLITVQGKDNRKVGVTGILASMTAFNKSRKTLMVQLTNSQECSIEKMLIGKVMDSRSINGRDFTSKFEKGIDALLREATTGLCDDETFTDCCESLIINKNNMLDVACISQKTNFEDEVIKNPEPIKAFLQSAQKVYEYVYVLLPDNEQIISEFTELANFNVYCVEQKFKKLYSLGKKDFLVITDFEPGSMFNLSYMKKIYNLFTIYTVPHDVKYRDSIMTNNAFEFIKKNVNNSKNDDHYSFSRSLSALINKVTYSSKDDTELETEAAAPKELDVAIEAEETLEVIVPDTLPEVTVKKRLFGKRKVYITEKQQITCEKAEVEVSTNTQAESIEIIEEAEEEIVTFDKNNIKSAEITKLKHRMLSYTFGSDVQPLVTQVRESLMGAILYSLCIEQHKYPENITVTDFSQYIKKLNCKRLQKKYKKNPEAGIEAMAYEMAAPNAKIMVMKELPSIAQKLTISGYQLLTEV